MSGSVLSAWNCLTGVHIRGIESRSVEVASGSSRTIGSAIIVVVDWSTTAAPNDPEMSPEFGKEFLRTERRIERSQRAARLCSSLRSERKDGSRKPVWAVALTPYPASFECAFG
jgi:hypothetical protein